MNPNQERRLSDARVSQLVDDVTVLKHQMAENTAVTCQVRDILASFKGMMSLAKWIAAIAGAFAAVIAAYKGADFRR